MLNNVSEFITVEAIANVIKECAFLRTQVSNPESRLKDVNFIGIATTVAAISNLGEYEDGLLTSGRYFAVNSYQGLSILKNLSFKTEVYFDGLHDPNRNLAKKIAIDESRILKPTEFYSECDKLNRIWRGRMKFVEMQKEPAVKLDTELCLKAIHEGFLIELPALDNPWDPDFDVNVLKPRISDWDFTVNEYFERLPMAIMKGQEF